MINKTRNSGRVFLHFSLTDIFIITEHKDETLLDNVTIIQVYVVTTSLIFYTAITMSNTHISGVFMGPRLVE